MGKPLVTFILNDQECEYQLMECTFVASDVGTLQNVGEGPYCKAAFSRDLTRQFIENIGDLQGVFAK